VGATVLVVSDSSCVVFLCCVLGLCSCVVFLFCSCVVFVCCVLVLCCSLFFCFVNIDTQLRAFDGCRQLDAAHNLKYIMGHTHCNEITAHDEADGSALGFMVAGQGMEGCGNFGFPLVETLTGEHSRIEVIYYELQNLTKNSDRYEIVLECFQENGPLGCKELGTMWLNQTIGDTVWK
jgi:hypothetical protein